MVRGKDTLFVVKEELDKIHPEGLPGSKRRKEYTFMTYVEDPNHPNHNELLKEGVTSNSLGVHNEAKLKVVLKRPEMIELFMSTKTKEVCIFLVAHE